MFKITIKNNHYTAKQLEMKNTDKGLTREIVLDREEEEEEGEEKEVVFFAGRDLP